MARTKEPAGLTPGRPGRRRRQQPPTAAPAVSRARGRLAHPREIVLDALTAAAVRANRKNSGYMRRLVQPWQQLALSYYDRVPEVWNAAQFYSRSLKQIRLFAAQRDDSGEIEETDNAEAQAAVARIQDPGGGGYKRLMDAYGRIKFLTGEGYFLVTNPDGDDERWEFVSSDELRINSAGDYTRFMAPSLPAEEFTDIPDTAYKPLGHGALVYRVWRPHPRFSALADSPVRAQLKVLEELELLTLAIGAGAKNRMAVNGILYIPESLTDPQIDPGTDEDPNADPFLNQLVRQIVAPITDPGTAAAAAPVILKGPDDAGEKIKWIEIGNRMESYPESDIRDELIRRFAVGIEMPAEILTGVADVTHWTAWLIDNQAKQDYIFPLLEELCNDLTAVFLRPVLEAANVPDWDSFVIGYDASKITQQADRGKDAKDLHDRLAISDQALRDNTDFSDADAPSQEEWDRRAALKMMNPAALTGDYEQAPTPAITADEVQEGIVDAGDAPNAVEQGIPDTNPSRNGGIDGSIEGMPQVGLNARVLGACDMAVARARELAGARLRSRVNGDAPDGVDKVPNDQLPAALGADWVRQHAARSDLELVAGGGRTLVATLARMGVSDEQATQLAELVTTHAARTLYQQRPSALPRSVVGYTAQLGRLEAA